jgi:GWxTD domain-containing protein
MGITAVEEGRYDAAIRHLRAVLDERPQYRHPRDGAAAWWLGRAHRMRGDSSAAHAAWRAGVNALGATDAFDVRLTDAYLRSVFDRGKEREYRTAATLYLRLLSRAERPLSPAERAVVHRHLAQVRELLPSGLRTAVEHLLDSDQASRKDTAPRVATWWHRQDPRPATRHNERVVEHLRRVSEAEQQFPSSRDAAGFDERGHLFVRLGEPSVRTTLDNEALETDELTAFGGVSYVQSVVPPHEVWAYPALSDHATYIFVEQNGDYTLGTVRGLLPPQLRRVSAVQGSRAGLALRVLRDYYDQLATLAPNYLQMWNAIRNYELLASEETNAARMQSLSTMESTLGGGTQSVTESMPEAATQTLWAAQREDAYLARKRRETVPRVRSAAVDPTEALPMTVRTARFLTEAGETRTEVYWAVDPSDLSPSPANELQLLQSGLAEPDRYVLRLTSVRYGPRYASRHVARRTMTLPAAGEPRTYVLSVPEATPTYHLALQWDQLAPRANGAPVHVRRGTHRADSLQALSPAANRLQLSDLVPLRADALQPGAPVRDEKGFRVEPYPYDHVAPETSLALYLEAYHLAYGPGDRTRYTVEYRIVQRTERDGIRGWFGGTTERATAQAATYESTSRRVQEYVTIDLAPYADASEVRVDVRVTDEVTGESAERSIRFTIGPEKQ